MAAHHLLPPPPPLPRRPPPFPCSYLGDFFPTRTCCRRNYSEGTITPLVSSRLAKSKESPPAASETLIKEPHNYFDQVIITVRAGDGGHGAVLSMPVRKAPTKSRGKQGGEKTRQKSLYRRDSDGSLILPMGGHGGDVIIFADESKDSLLEFHVRKRYSAKRGGHVDAMGVLTSQLRDGLPAPTLRILVPVLL